MFTYGEAEKLLAALHGADRERQLGAFRARLKHFKKLGIPIGVNPGRGKKIEYAREHLYQWVFCLEYSQFGIDPTWIVNAIEKYWHLIYWIFKRAEYEDDDDLFMVFVPAFMTHAWSEPLSDTPFFGSIQKSKIQTVVDRMRGNTRRIGMINVSEIVRLIQEAERDLPQRAKAKREEAASPVIENEAAVAARNAAYANYLRYLENAWKNPAPQPAPSSDDAIPNTSDASAPPGRPVRRAADELRGAIQRADEESRAKTSAKSRAHTKGGKL